MQTGVIISIYADEETKICDDAWRIPVRSLNPQVK